MQISEPVAPLPLDTLPTGIPASMDASRRLRWRATLVICAIWSSGALPWLLQARFGFPIPSKLQVFGWGLWLPGAGFIATGGWSTLLFPLTLLLFNVALLLWALSGLLVLPLGVWLISAVIASTLAGPHVASHTAVLVPALSLAIVSWKAWDEYRCQRREVVVGRQRNAILSTLLTRWTASAPQNADDHSADELSPDELAAARYLFDRALQPVGEFDGFTRIDNIQGASLRYQLNYISYALATLQCRYTPSFHGYLNQAQRYAIEALTSPAVCSYWKWECLGGQFRWHPDPIGTRDNVMLTGWSLVALTTYAANTGDLRYQKSGALAFRPSARSSRSYAHDARTLSRSILQNWQQSPTTLYACEPFWVFPLCNAFAYSALVPYDRTNGTRHAATVHAQLVQRLESDFMLADGTVRGVLSTLTGWRWLGRALPEQVNLGFLLQLCRVANAFHPGYARRWYALVREQYLQLKEGELGLKGIGWSELTDAGNYRKSPGYMLSCIALAAREHGDDAMAEAALRKADELLKPNREDGVIAFENVSNSTNTNLAAARWSRRNDWQHLITRGPAKETFAGPLLTECVYPQVLVAKAHGNAGGLDLVLYNGAESGAQSLRIERLRPHSRYQVHGALPAEIRTGDKTHADITVQLDGRTPVQLRLQKN